jgi:uncharacterized protein (TIGR03067 family)
MKRLAISIVTLLLVATLSCAGQPSATTAPANALIGRWQVLSMGKKKMPDKVQLFWTFDERNVIVTVANGDVASTSQYSLRKDGEHDIISLSEDGKKEPNRVGWYELKKAKLRIQLTLDTGKPPDQWNEDEVMLFESAPTK